MTLGKAVFRADHALEGLEQAYARGEDDEFVQTTILHLEGEEPAMIKDGDAVICMNHRADRSRELTRAFVDTSFDSFVRSARPRLSEFVMLSEYASDLDASCAFPTTQPKNVLGEHIAALGKSQLRMAETEKYGHVTFFFNGGSEEPFAAAVKEEGNVTLFFRADHALEGLEQAYARGEDDEFVQTTILHLEGEEPAMIKDGDAVICMNHRADRSRELTRAFVDTSFDSFVRSARPRLSEFVMLSEYASDLDASCAFPTTQPKNVLGEHIAALGKSQLRMAETEKYGHVTFFFNGGSEEPFANEERVLIPSPDVPTYDLKPEMSAHQLTDELVKAIESKRFDLIVCNYANGDMVGHTGNFGAAIKAVETLDECLARVVTAIGNVHGECIITADHGNVEQMSNKSSGQPHTAHTCELVPFVLISERDCMVEHREGGLADIAPTLLHLMGLEQPTEMTGESLVRFL